MKYLLIILLSLFGLSGYSQLMQTNGTAGGYQFVALKGDSLFIIPRGIDTPTIGPTKYGKSTVGALFYKTTDSTFWVKSSNKWNQISGTGGSGIQSVVGGYRINVDATDPVNPIVNSMDTSYNFIFEAPIQANVYGDTVYVYLDSTGNGDYSIAHHSFGYYLGVFLTAAQAANTYITYDSAQGKYVDTGYNSNDSFYLVKNGSPFLLGIAAGSAGDTTVFETVIDSTGQPGQRVLFSGGNGHIKSDSYFLFDSVNNKLVINHNNISVGGSGIKLFVQGNTNLNGSVSIASPATTSDTTYKPLVVSSSGGIIRRFNYWPVVNDPAKLNISDTATMLSNSVRRVLAGTNVTVDNTNPQYPIVSATGSSITGVYQVITATAGQTAFTFTSVPTTSATYNVFINGSACPKSYYSVASNTITFSAGLTLNDVIMIQGVQ